MLGRRIATTAGTLAMLLATQDILGTQEDGDLVSPDASELIDGVDFGLALFDDGLKLIKANDTYYDLCGYELNQAPPGTPLSEMMTISLRGKDLDERAIESSIATTLKRLQGDSTHKFRFETNHGKYISVTRKRNVAGRLVETVHELQGPDTAGGDSQHLHKLAELARLRMSYALEAMADGFALYDDDDRLVTYNQQYIELNPHIADLIKPGAQYEAMLREGVGRGGFDLHGMDPEAFIEWRLQQHLNPGDAYISQLTDGRWIRLQERQTDDGGIVSTRADITDLKKQELENDRISIDLDRASDQLDEALNNMVQGLCMFDANRRLILCNRQYLEMYGFSSEVVKPGILMADIMRYSISLGNYREEDAQKALASRNDKRNLSERTIIKQYLKDGRVIAVLNEPMANGGTIATYEDITKLEKHEAQLVAYTNKLVASNRELQDFAYVASHDLQEPLRKIEAFGDRLVKKHSALLPDDGQMYLERMQNAAGRMRQLINDLLSYSRVTTKAKPFSKVDLDEVLKGVLSDIQMRIEDSGGTVECSALPTIDADNTQMRQLFQNLISNALKFAKPDVAPLVKISSQKVVIHTDNGIPMDFWRIELSDNGIGFDNKFKDQIFAIFQRLHGRLEYEGTGIGLATCRKIVERHHGTIDATGEPDVGATFIIELPATQIQEVEE